MSIPEGAGTSIRLLGASVLIGCNIVPRHPFTIMQDLDILKSIKWEAIVIDGYRYSGLSHDLEQIRMLTTDLRILLVSGQIKVCYPSRSSILFIIPFFFLNLLFELLRIQHLSTLISYRCLNLMMISTN